MLYVGDSDIMTLCIDRKEVLRYLGYRGQYIGSDLDSLIGECIDETKSIIKPRYTYKAFQIVRRDGNIHLMGCTLTLEGRDIARQLENANLCILMAVTLGNAIDTKIRYYEKVDMTKALILDACATTAVEEVCDNLCNEIEDGLRYRGQKLTYRYSPGYGDFSIDIQRDFISVLRADRGIGLNVSSHSILVPRKSVTAIVGIVDIKQAEGEKGCLNCSRYLDCKFRKAGDAHGC